MGGVAVAGGYFLDTFAIVEYLSGNAKFARYVDHGDCVTSIFNLTELYFAALRDHSEEYADRVYLAFRPNLVEITDEDVKEGMLDRLRLKAKGAGLSYADAVGYAMAKRTRRKFLTGDRAFSDLPGVEFVK